MTNITKAETVYVSTSDNADYVEATPHEGAVKFVRADLVDPAVQALAEHTAKAIREAALREAAGIARKGIEAFGAKMRAAPEVLALVEALENVIGEYDLFRKEEYDRGLAPLDDEIHEARATLADIKSGIATTPYGLEG